jgi:hypothetical protein
MLFISGEYFLVENLKKIVDEKFFFFYFRGRKKQYLMEFSTNLYFLGPIRTYFNSKGFY